MKAERNIGKGWGGRKAESATVFSMATYAMQMRPVLQDLARRLRESCEAGDAGVVRDLVRAKADVYERDAVRSCLARNIDT